MYKTGGFGTDGLCCSKHGTLNRHRFYGNAKITIETNALFPFLRRKATKFVLELFSALGSKVINFVLYEANRAIVIVLIQLVAHIQKRALKVNSRILSLVSNLTRHIAKADAAFKHD